jgi:hypothetical protein
LAPVKDAPTSFNTPRGRSSPAPFAEAIAEPSRFHRQIDALASRADGARLDQMVQDGVRFTQLIVERDRVVELLRRAMADASYRPGQARVARSFIGGKWREIARLSPLDLIAHGVVAEVLGERLESHLSPRVYSYRVKRSPWHALRWLGTVAKLHRAKRPDPRTRGIYVLRADIQSYAPSIPLGDDSAIWPQLRDVCGLDEESPHWALVRSLIVQDLVGLEGEALPRHTGVLFGAPTSNALMNLYLMPLDDALVAHRGAYARFGDDVLFAHSDPKRVQEARAILERVLAERRLQPSPTKMHVLYWNGAARPSLEWPEARPVVRVQFLGGCVGFDGTVSMSPAKWKLMLHDVRARIRRTARLMPDETPEVRAKVLADVANEAFDLRSDLGLGHKEMIADLVSDRRQLAQLDYLLALWIAEASTGARGPSAFRRIGYRWLRRSAGLASRVVFRNGR